MVRDFFSRKDCKCCSQEAWWPCFPWKENCAVESEGQVVFAFSSWQGSERSTSLHWIFISWHVGGFCGWCMWRTRCFDRIHRWCFDGAVRENCSSFFKSCIRAFYESLWLLFEPNIRTWVASYSCCGTCLGKVVQGQPGSLLWRQRCCQSKLHCGTCLNFRWWTHHVFIFVTHELQLQLKSWFSRVPTSSNIADGPSRLDCQLVEQLGSKISELNWDMIEKELDVGPFPQEIGVNGGWKTPTVTTPMLEKRSVRFQFESFVYFPVCFRMSCVAYLVSVLYWYIYIYISLGVYIYIYVYNCTIVFFTWFERSGC